MIPILILAILILLCSCGAVIWIYSRLRQEVKVRSPLRWHHLALPSTILLLSLILAGIFYPRLPEEVAYHFRSDGSPDRWLRRETLLFWMLLPQFVLTLLAGAITLGISRVVPSRQPDGGKIRMEKLIAIMGNMMALPQIILCFAMLDIFSYNSYQIHLLPLWVFALMVIIAGTIILGLFFKSAVRPRQGTAT